MPDQNMPALSKRAGATKTVPRAMRGKRSYARQQAARRTDKRVQSSLAEARAARLALEVWLADVARREAESAAFAAGLAMPGVWEKGMGPEACARLRADIIARSRWSLREAVDQVLQGYSIAAVARRTGWPSMDIATAMRESRRADLLPWTRP